MKKNNFFLKDRLTEEQIEKFKLFADEELIFACREHWLPLLFRNIKQLLLGVMIAFLVAAGFIIVFGSIGLSLLAFYFTILLTLFSATRTLIHWNFHIYIATTKQIIEVHYDPLISHGVNSVLLDQIRCTEIDVSMYGVIPELIGIGNVEITFDRPTHKEVFVIKGVRSPRLVANLLSAQIHQGIQNNALTMRRFGQPIWVKELKKNKYRFLGDVQYGYTAT